MVGSQTHSHTIIYCCDAAQHCASSLVHQWYLSVRYQCRIQLAVDVQIPAGFGGLGASAVYIGDILHHCHLRQSLNLAQNARASCSVWNTEGVVALPHVAVFCLYCACLYHPSPAPMPDHLAIQMHNQLHIRICI